MKTSHRVRLVGVVAMVTLAAGCATKNTSTSDSGSAGVSDKSIKIGGVVVKSSPTGYSTGDTEIGAKARFDRANAEGGVNGRKIEFSGAEDDGMDPAKGGTAAKKLVQKDKVFALVPVNSPVFGGGPFLEQSKVPWFGWATGPQWCGTTTGFGYNGCLAPKPGAGSQTWWGNLVAAQVGGAKGKTAFIQGTDSSGSKYGVGTIGHSFAAAGFALVGTSVAIPSTAPPADFSPYVNKIMKSNKGGPPDVVVSVIAGGKFNTGLYAGLKKAGYKGAITDAVSYDPKILADPAAKAALDGVLAAPMFEPFESDSPEVAKMKADIQKAAPGTSVFTQSMAIGYWSADIFLKIAEKSGKTLTRDSFLQAASNFSYENPGFGKISYPKDQSEPNGCGALVKLSGGAFSVVQHLKCFDNVPLK
jgi:branched-chain amino acid transport system substrate-binding protein